MAGPEITISTNDYRALAEKAIVIKMALPADVESQLFLLDGEWILAVNEADQPNLERAVTI